MKHWLTKEEMGDGFQHNEKEDIPISIDIKND